MSFKYPFLTEPLYLLPASSVFYSLLEIINIILKHDSISSDSVSPAFLIRVGASMNYSGSGEEEESDSKENIYEEIKDKHEEEPSKDPAKESRKSSSSSAETADTGAGTKSKFQKALEAVTRRSSRSLDAGSEKSFHLR